MLATLRKRFDREDEGFTLIELMVVVLIIAILLAIAIPTFLGARERAQDRAAQSDLRNTLAAEKVFYTDSEDYTETAADLTDIEPSLGYVTGVDPAGDEDNVYVAIDAANPDVVCMTRLSASGTTFVLADIATGANAGTYYFEAALAACDEASASAGASEW